MLSYGMANMQVVVGTRQCKRCASALIDAPPSHRQKTFCSHECTKNKVTRACDACGLSVTKAASYAVYTTMYCNRECAVTGKARAERSRFAEPAPVPHARWISLGACRFALIDEHKFDEINALVWGCQYQAKSIQRPYASSHRTLMHRMIMRAPAGAWVDHINGNTLDNREANLRIATPIQNAMNAHKKSRGAGRYKGIEKSGDAWVARIRVDGKPHYIGRFNSQENAAKAYDSMARAHHGDYARLNFPNPGEQSALRMT